jgi:hypothetical protein
LAKRIPYNQGYEPKPPTSSTTPTWTSFDLDKLIFNLETGSKYKKRKRR